MPESTDRSPFSSYAHPERLVSTEWLAEQIAAGAVGGPDGIVVLESDEDVLLYDTGHIPGALKLDWHQDLNDPVMRDYVDAEQFARGDVRPRRRPRHDRGHLRRQEQLVGRLRPVGAEPVRPRGRAAARRRPRQVGRRGP